MQLTKCNTGVQEASKVMLTEPGTLFLFDLFRLAKVGFLVSLGTALFAGVSRFLFFHF